MRLPFVQRSELDLVRCEGDEWRRRAESGLRPGVVEAERPRTRRRMRWPGPVFATIVLAVALGAVTLPGRSGGAVRPDYAGCIGQARYEDPIEGNQYQELVNALYACGIYEKAAIRAP